MELKVWCEGIQRVICGVSEDTSCHNVVVALAQAMGKTGRYTLIEKWRDSERLVSPDEFPLLILHKWGEYANDVQFILRHSGAKDRPGSGGRRDDASDSGRTSKLSYHNFTPHLSESRSSSTSSLRKSLTFSGGHSHSLLVPKSTKRTDCGGPRHGLIKDSSLESLAEHSLSSNSQFITSSAHSSLEPRQRTRLQDSVSSQSSATSSLDPRNKSSVPPTRQAPPSSPLGGVPFNYTNGSLDRTRKRYHGNAHHNHQLSNSSSSSSQPPSSLSSLHTSRSSNGGSRSSSNGYMEPPARDRPSPPNLVSQKESNNNTDYKPNANLASVRPTVLEEREGSALRDAREEVDLEHKRTDLIKAINLQMEEMTRQEEDISHLDKDITAREEMAAQRETDEARVLAEIDQLLKQEVDLDSDIQDLELVSWVDKLEMEMEKERRIQTEIQNFRVKIRDCGEHIGKQEQLIKKLSSDLDKEQTVRIKEALQRKEQEQKTRHEISVVQAHLNDSQTLHVKQQTVIEQVEAEVKVTDGLIQEKTTEVLELERQLKDSNMERFSRSPADWIRSSHEGGSGFNRASVKRPGSARRLESPQRLKETVATVKNPHGLWV